MDNILEIISFDSIDSTNNYLKKNYNNLSDLTICKTKHQTKGRGRLTRTWNDNFDKSLLFSILLKKNLTTSLAIRLNQIVPLSIVNVLREYNIPATIKWPNDIIVNNKKICGILIENIYKNGIEAVIVGIGLNILKQPNLGEYSTTFEANSKVEVSKSQLLHKIVENIMKLTTQDQKKVHENYVKNSYVVGKKVTINLNDEQKNVEIITINEDNEIVFKDEINKITTSVVGEISLLNIYK